LFLRFVCQQTLVICAASSLHHKVFTFVSITVDKLVDVTFGFGFGLCIHLMYS